ncbi:hypothetical protein ACFVP7_06680 [Bacillus sp. SG20033]|uniref:hypothetical protein n=1 Tax=Bacillus sp. SG20033 TaxID=3366583 RepID=UPI0037C9B4F4
MKRIIGLIIPVGFPFWILHFNPTLPEVINVAIIAVAALIDGVITGGEETK